MQNRYFVVYKSQTGGVVQDASTIIALDAPIQFDSDITAVAEYLAAQQGADAIMLVNWIPLVAAQRPALEPAPSIQEQSRQVAEQIIAKTQEKKGYPKPAAKAPPKVAKPSIKPERRAK